MYFLLALGLPGGLGSEDMGGGGAYEGGGLARAFDKGGMAEGVCGTANTFIQRGRGGKRGEGLGLGGNITNSEYSGGEGSGLCRLIIWRWLSGMPRSVSNMMHQSLT